MRRGRIIGVGTNENFVPKWQSPDLPSPTITSGPEKAGRCGWLLIEETEQEDMTTSTNTKPPYRVPLMAEIAKIKWNGRKVASTFSGGGGSCTGYRMAGLQVVWANEFIPEAQKTYRENHPETHLDPRDIKLVTAEDILAATGLKVGELDIFDGSPPCQSFSTAGKGAKGWAASGGEGKTYENGVTQNNELLFYEYVRLLKGLQPKVFIAENVKGLTIGESKKLMGDPQLGMFGGVEFQTKAGQKVVEIKDEDTILHRLIDAGYVVHYEVLDAADLGVPQTRNRVIFIGVRNDIAAATGVLPCFPKPLGYTYTVRDALPWIGAVAGGDSGCRSDERGKEIGVDRPLPAVVACDGRAGRGKTQFQVAEVENDPVKPKPEEFVELPPSRSPGSYGVTEIDPNKPCPTVTCASPGNDLAVPVDPVEAEVAKALAAQPSLKKPKSGTGGFGEGGPTVKGDDVCPAIMAQGLGGVGHGQYDVEVVHESGGKYESGGVITDKPSPTLMGSKNQGHFSVVVKDGKRVDGTNGGSLELDKSRLEVCDGTNTFGSAGEAATPDKPSPPVLTPSNSVVNGPERRKFTIPEVKRLCSFPDDYIFSCSYSKAWERLGNSVPPVMMFAIAKALLEGVFPHVEAWEENERRQGRLPV